MAEGYDSFWVGTQRRDLHSNPQLHQNLLQGYTNAIITEIMSSRKYQDQAKTILGTEQTALETLPLISELSGITLVDKNGKYHQIELDAELKEKLKNLFKKPPSDLGSTGSPSPKTTSVDEDLQALFGQMGLPYVDPLTPSTVNPSSFHHPSSRSLSPQPPVDTSSSFTPQQLAAQRLLLEQQERRERERERESRNSSSSPLPPPSSVPITPRQPVIPTPQSVGPPTDQL